MRKIIILLMALALLPVVLAFDVGDIITQEQLDSINASKIDLHCQLEDEGEFPYWRYHNHRWYWARNVSCLSIEPYGEDEYIIIRPHHYPHFLLRDFLICTQRHSIPHCVIEYRTFLRDQHKDSVNSLRLAIANYQTDTSELFDFYDEFEV